MNTKTTTKLATFRRENLPIICPSCSGSLGVIDEHDLAQRYAWGIAISPLDIAAPGADPSITIDANLIRGECPSCSAELAAISITFRREHEHGADGADEPARLSLVLHGGAYSGWAMIETRDAGGVECIEHLFEPRPAARIERAVEYLREHLLADLPRPGGGSGP